MKKLKRITAVLLTAIISVSGGLTALAAEKAASSSRALTIDDFPGGKDGGEYITGEYAKPENFTPNIKNNEIKEILENSVVFYEGYYKVAVNSYLIETDGKECVSDGKISSKLLNEKTSLKAEGEISDIKEIAEKNGKYYYEIKNLYIVSEKEIKTAALEKHVLSIEKLFGLFVAPDRQGGTGEIDAPLASITSAKDMAKKVMNQIGYLSDEYSVVIRGGSYSVSNTINFTEADSGFEDCKLIFEAFPNEAPVFDGGVAIKGAEFTKVTDEKVLSVMYPEAREKVYQVQITGDNADVLKNLTTITPYYNGDSMTNARWPNTTYATTGKTIRNGADRLGIEFEYDEAKIQWWKKARYPRMYGRLVWTWKSDDMAISKIDTEKNTINTTEKPYYTPIGEQKEWYIYNLIEELDAQNEFYFDRDTAILYIMPYQSDVESGDFKNIDVQIPIMNEVMFNVVGAKDIEFRGLTICNSNAMLLKITESQNIAVKGCKLHNTAGEGINVSGETTQSIRIDSNDIYKTGTSNSITATGGNKQTLFPANILIVNNKCSDTGALNVNGVAIKVAHNQINDTHHLAVSYSGFQIYVEYNEIFNTITNQIADAGSIYQAQNILFADCWLRYNYMHDCYPSIATIYQDDHTPNQEIYGNVFYNTPRAIFDHGGRNNNIYNNIMIHPSNPTAEAVRFENANWQKWDPETKEQVSVTAWQMWKYIYDFDAQTPLMLERYPIINEMFKTGYARYPEGSSAYNNVAIYKANPREEAVTVATDIEDGMVEVGKNYSTTEDIGFVDMENGNFELKEDAKIYDILPGFESVPFNEMGLYLNEYRSSYEDRNPVKLVSPSSKEENLEAKEVTFTWTSDRNTTKYKFELALDRDFKEIVRSEYLNYTNITVKNLRYGGTRYYWRVYSCYSNEQSSTGREELLCTDGYSTFTTAASETIETATAEEELKKTKALAETVVEGNVPGGYFEGTKAMFADLISRFEKLIDEKAISQKKFDKEVDKLVAEKNKLNARRETETITLNSMLADGSSWTYQPNAVAFINGGFSWLRSSTGDNQILAYKAKKIETNQLVKFKTVLESQNEKQWQYFSMRSSAYDQPYNNMKTYIVIIKPDQGIIELQRYGTGKTLFIEYKCDEFKDNKECIVEMGAVDTEDGNVNCIFKVNGTEYINYIDDSEYKVTEPGYFTAYKTAGNIGNALTIMPISDDE